MYMMKSNNTGLKTRERMEQVINAVVEIAPYAAMAQTSDTAYASRSQHGIL